MGKWVKGESWIGGKGNREKTKNIHISLVASKARRHADMSTRHFDLGIHVDISTLSILLDIQTRHVFFYLFFCLFHFFVMEKKGMIVRW